MILDLLRDLLHNHIVIGGMLAGLAAQVAKVIVSTVIHGKFSFARFREDGGMPSGHSATVTSLCLLCGWCCGFDSAAFAISFVMASIVMRDALGVRREAGKHARLIKELSRQFNDLVNGGKPIQAETLKELVGHTPLQVLFGALLGIAFAAAYIAVFAIPYGSFT